MKPTSPCPFNVDFAYDLQRALCLSKRLYTQPPTADGALLVASLAITDLVVVSLELNAVLDALRLQWRHGVQIDQIDVRLSAHGVRRIRFGLCTQALLLRLNELPDPDQSIRDFVKWASRDLTLESVAQTSVALERVLTVLQARTRWALPAGAADRVLLLHNGRTAAPSGHKLRQRTVTRYQADLTPSIARLAEVQQVITEAARKGLSDRACRRLVGETVALWSNIIGLEELVRALVLKWTAEEKDPHTITAYSSIGKGIFAFLETRCADIEDVQGVVWLDYFATLPVDDRQQSKRLAVLADIRDVVGELAWSGHCRSEPIGYVRTIGVDVLPDVEQRIREQSDLPAIVVESAISMLHTCLRYGLRSEELVTRKEAAILRGDDDLVSIRRSPDFSGKSIAAYRLIGPDGIAAAAHSCSPPVFVTDGLDQDTIDEANWLLGWALAEFGAVVHGLRTRALSQALSTYFMPGESRSQLDDTALLNAEASVAIFAGHAGPGTVSGWYFADQDRERREWADHLISEDLQRLKAHGHAQGCDKLIAQLAGATPEAVRQRRSRQGVRHFALLKTYMTDAGDPAASVGSAEGAAPHTSSDEARMTCGLIYLAARLGTVDVVAAITASRVCTTKQEVLERALRIGRLSKIAWSLKLRKREPLVCLAKAAMPLLQGLASAPTIEQVSAMGSALQRDGALSILDLDHLAALPPLAGLLRHLRLMVVFDPARHRVDDIQAHCRLLGALEVLAQPGAALSLRLQWRDGRTEPSVSATRATYLAFAGWWALNVGAAG